MIPPCVMCGADIDPQIIASRARVVARLGRGHRHDPPKVGSACLSEALGFELFEPTLTLVKPGDQRT